MLYATPAGCRRVSLGAVERMGVEEARRECLARLAEPRRERKEELSQVVPLLRDFVAGDWNDAYFERYKPSTKRSVRSLVAGRILPAFGSTPFDRIAPAAVRQWFDAYSRTAPGNANHAVDLLGLIVNFVVARGHIDANPARGTARNR